MTREDRSRDVATTGRRRAKTKRTAGVGRTGARFPSARALTSDEPDEAPGKDEDDLSSQSPAVGGVSASGQAVSGQAASGHALASGQAASGHALTSGQAASGHALTSGQAASNHALTSGQGAGSSQAAGPAQTDAFAQFDAFAQADTSAEIAGSGQFAGSDRAPAPPAPSASSAVDVDADARPPEDVVGRTGARFGPYSARKPKRAKEFDTGRTPVVASDEARVDTPPGEPTPEQSAERTMPLILPWAGALVRPYAHTGGRTRSSHDLALEALVSTSGHHSGAVVDEVLTTHHRRMIVDLCAQPRSVAEIAALLSVPLGVARVLLGDLATAGVVVVHPTAGSTGDGAPDVEFMRRVLVGLRRL